MRRVDSGPGRVPSAKLPCPQGGVTLLTLLCGKLPMECCHSRKLTQAVEFKVFAKVSSCRHHWLSCCPCSLTWSASHPCLRCTLSSEVRLGSRGPKPQPCNHTVDLSRIGSPHPESSCWHKLSGMVQGAHNERQRHPIIQEIPVV